MNLTSSVVYFFSANFMLFFVLVLILYWTAPQRIRNSILLVASYAFYSCWDWRFSILLFASTFTDFFAARGMEDQPSRKKLCLVVSLVVNLGLLAVFKYANFFIDSANAFFLLAGMGPMRHLNIVLPLGISFYTFQTISYSLDVYRGKQKALRNPIEFAVFVAYFPQLIAGPIERANHLIPQIKSPKNLWSVPWREATYLFCYGFFKKRVVADFMAYATTIGYGTDEHAGALTLVGFLAYCFQVYADISGYADMARGVSLFLGIRLTPNFFFPYFATDPVQFWKRWHITLSTWARHYVFNPLLTRLRRPRAAILITFMVMGIWHGPRWHFIHWGLYWAFWSIAFQWRPIRRAFLLPVAMPLVIFVGQSFFNADSVTHYLGLWSDMGKDLWSPQILDPIYLKTFMLMALFTSYEAWLAHHRDELYLIKRSFYIQASFYFALLFLYRNVGGSAAIDFIYFSF